MNLSYNISFAIASLFITVVLILIINLKYSASSIINKRYKMFLYSLFIMIILDIGTVISNDYANKIPLWLNLILNTLYFLSGALVAIFFLYYCVSIALPKVKPNDRKKIYLINLIILGIYILTLIFNIFFKFYFYYDNYVYTSGPLYLFVNSITVLYVIESLFFMIICRKSFNKTQLICTVIFYVSFFTSFILQLFIFKKVLLSDFGSAIGCLIVFFSLVTPDYIKLVSTLKELKELKDSLEIQVLNRTLELDNEKQQYKELTIETLSSLALVIDAKDHYTNGHSFRVAAYAKALAASLGYSKQECEKIYFAGLVHDVGKIGVSELIIRKPSALTAEEYAQIKDHTTIGGDILKGIKKFKVFEEVARYHHERYDGLGYPNGLKGQEIPVFARIVAVCDSFDAMMSDRSYRKALSLDKALSELENGKGKQFDAVIVDTFIYLVKRYDDFIGNHLDELVNMS